MDCHYITKDVTYTKFIPCPCELLDAAISATAKLVYLRLLERASLSRANDWVDEQGRVYIIYPVEKLAEEMAAHRFTMQKALKELDTLGLIERARMAFSQPNRIYVKMPNIAQGGVHTSPTGDNSTHANVTSSGTKSLQKTSRQSDTNYIKNNYIKKNYNQDIPQKDQYRRENYENSDPANDIFLQMMMEGDLT